jgi:hypothetical protein
VSLTTLKYGPLCWFSESKPVPLSPCRHRGIERFSSESCLTSPLSRVSAERYVPAALTSGEWTPGTHWIEGWVGLRAGLETGTRETYISSAGNRTPVVQCVVRDYTD